MRYIRQVKVQSPGTHNEHIVEVRYSTSTTGSLQSKTRAGVVTDIDNRIDSYRSHNDSNGDEAAVAVRSNSRIRYIATVADGRETNNLLRLPRYV